MSSKDAVNPGQAPGGEPTNLGRKYGEIGISALAAALRYRSDGKNPAYAPVARQIGAGREDPSA